MSKARLLVIDDNPSDLAAVETLLTDNGYFVKTTDSSVQFADLLGEGRYGAVVLNLELKHRTGYEVVVEIKGLDPHQEIIAVTTKKDVQTVVDLLKYGVRELLLKPIKPSQFLKILDDVVKRSSDEVTPETSAATTTEAEQKEKSPMLRVLLDLLSVLDLERLVEDLLDLLMRAIGAGGAMLWLAKPGEGGSTRLAFSSARGLILEKEQWAFFPIDKEPFKSAVAAGSPFVTKASGKSKNEKILYLPIVCGGEVLGLARISEKQDGEDFVESDLRSSRYIGEFAGVAINNAQRFSSLQKQTLRDYETNAYNLAYFNDYVRKETYKSRRYDRPFSVVKLSIDNWAIVKKKVPEASALKARENVVSAMVNLLREADLVARKSENEFLVLLPETDYFGSLISIRRIRKAIGAKRYVTEGAESISLGLNLTSATFPKDGNSLERLEEIINKRADINRASVYNKYDLENVPFWSVAEQFIGDAGAYDLAGSGVCLDQQLKNLNDADGITRHGVFTPEMIDSVELLINSEIRKNPNNRGILYLGSEIITEDRPFVRRGLPLHIGSTKVFVVGEKKLDSWKASNITPIYLSDENIQKHRFIFYLNEEYSYTLLAQSGGKGKYFGFHSSDQILVENFISKLQDNYFMQKHL